MKNDHRVSFALDGDTLELLDEYVHGKYDLTRSAAIRTAVRVYIGVEGRPSAPVPKGRDQERIS